MGTPLMADAPTWYQGALENADACTGCLGTLAGLMHPQGAWVHLIQLPRGCQRTPNKAGAPTDCQGRFNMVNALAVCMGTLDIAYVPTMCLHALEMTGAASGCQMHSTQRIHQ